MKSNETTFNNSEKNTFDQIESLIKGDIKKASMLRWLGIGFFIIIGIVLLLSFFYFLSIGILFQSINDMKIFLIIYLTTISFFIYLIRQFFALSNAYALRNGQLEDLLIILMLKSNNKIEIENSLSLVLSLKRMNIDEMMNNSLPSDFIATTIDKLFKKSKEDKK